MTLRGLLGLPAIAGASLAAVGAALYSQHALGMLPCAWCVLQRLLFLAVAVAALLGLILGALLPDGSPDGPPGGSPGGSGRRIGAALVAGLAGLGMAAALWQHFVATASGSCDMTLADKVMGFFGLDSRWPELFAAYASCADAQVNLVGVPYAFWSLALFALLALAALRLLIRPA